MADMKALVEYIAASVVNQPDQVEVQVHEGRRYITYNLLVAQEDMGRVIGKKGRMASAMRNLLRVAAVRSDKRVSLEIGDE